jgi:hypothetical protein
MLLYLTGIGKFELEWSFAASLKTNAVILNRYC